MNFNDRDALRLAIYRLALPEFDDDGDMTRDSWTPDQISESQLVSVRYVRSAIAGFVRAGLLDPIGGGKYRQPLDGGYDGRGRDPKGRERE